MGLIRKPMRPRDAGEQNTGSAQTAKPAGACPSCWKQRQQYPKHALGWLIPVPVYLEHGNYTEEICKRWTCDVCGRVPLVASKSTGALIPMLSNDSGGFPVYEPDRWPAVKKYRLHPAVLTEKILSGKERYFTLADLGGLLLTGLKEQAFYEPVRHAEDD